MQNVIDGCVAGGVARLVYTSSASVVFEGRDLVLVDESQRYAARAAVDYYTHTKIEGELERPGTRMRMMGRCGRCCSVCTGCRLLCRPPAAHQPSLTPISCPAASGDCP